MTGYVVLTFLVPACVLMAGCAPEYDTEKVAKVRTDAMIKEINNSVKLEDKYHEVRMTAAEARLNTQRLIKQSNIQLTKDADILAAGYKAADYLIKKLSQKLGKEKPILVAGFVDLDNLSQSSTFGRLVSRQFASRFNQKGYTTVEVKLPVNIFTEQLLGEFLLSPEIEQISARHHAQAVIIGTYAVASKNVYVTARVVNVKDGHVLCSYDYYLPIGHDTFKMLLKSKGEDNAGWL